MKGLSALMYASRQGNLDVVKILIPYEANIIDKQGMTALMHAVM